MVDDSRAIVDTLLRLFKTLRSRKNTSLESIADYAGIHRTHLGLLERGERQPSIAVGIQIARATGYELSELLAKAELVQSGKIPEAEALRDVSAREPRADCLRNQHALKEATGLDGSSLLAAIKEAYTTLDTIDAELLRKGVVPIAQLVELANLSSMVGNLLGSGLAVSSGGLYKRNRPHAYPDLLPQGKPARDLELKMALETNRPKGHLAKAGYYITFRYVLASPKGEFSRGKDNRGDTVWVWEVKVGRLEVSDFDISNTAGDSGKTAVIKTSAFKGMPLVYFDPALCPHPLKNGIYPAHN
ncbi:MAG TPA: helix-turn-helix domain-containing protein [Acidobacteriaceae bacterium]|jgi:transcriptional regulator with XRE-family HTH domain|nr:helix-turn-helix domain-containing protein [Acidobacteriaceae bacterium]